MHPNSINPASTFSNSQMIDFGSASQIPLSQELLDVTPFPFVISTCDVLSVAAKHLVDQLFSTPKDVLTGSFNFLTAPVSQGNRTPAPFHSAVNSPRMEALPTYYVCNARPSVAARHQRRTGRQYASRPGIAPRSPCSKAAWCKSHRGWLVWK